MAMQPPVGSGASALIQAIRGLTDKDLSGKIPRLEYATCVSDHEIRLDHDGYVISTEDGLVLVQKGVHFSPGDRLVVSPIGGPRGTVFVFGTWNPSKTIPSFKTAVLLQLVEIGDTVQTPLDTPDTGATTTETVVVARKQLGRNVLLPGTKMARFVGRVSVTGGSGAAVVRVYDDAEGARRLLWTHTGVGDIVDTFAMGALNEDDMNVIEVELSYSDAQDGQATISHCQLAIGEA